MSNDPASNADAARNQANSDINNGYNSPNMQNWDQASREAYEAQRRYAEELQRRNSGA